MNWIPGVVVFALFALARWTTTKSIHRAHATDLQSWYRTWDRDSSDHTATAAELCRMLETYRRGRRNAGRISYLPETVSAPAIAKR